MRVRHRYTGIKGESYMFLNKDLNKIIIGTEHGAEVGDVKDYEVYINGVGLVDMKTAFDDGTLVPDKYRNYFRESKTDQERKLKYCEQI